MKEQMKIGIIGTDTSHSIAFAELLNDSMHRFHVQGARLFLLIQEGLLTLSLAFLE